MNLASNPAEEKTTGTLAEGPSPQTDTHTEASHEAPTSKETQGASSDNNRSM